MGSNTGISEQLLTVLRERSPEDVTVAELAEVTGLDRRVVSTNVSNNARRRKESPGSLSPWVHVRRVRHGIYRYEEQPDAQELGEWSEVGQDGGRVVLRSPAGGLYVAVALRDVPL